MTKTRMELASEIVYRAERAGYLDRIFRVRRPCEPRLRDLAADVLRPHVPDGLCQWALLPGPREACRKYACRFVEYAAKRAKSAGGLTGVSDSHL